MNSDSINACRQNLELLHLLIDEMSERRQVGRRLKLGGHLQLGQIARQVHALLQPIHIFEDPLENGVDHRLISLQQVEPPLLAGKR